MIHYKNKNGFTLIETLVALAILSVALSATITLTRSIYLQAQKSGDISQMTSLANQELDTLRLKRDQSASHTLAPSTNIKSYAYAKKVESAQSCGSYVVDIPSNTVPGTCEVRAVNLSDLQSKKNWDFYTTTTTIKNIPVDGTSAYSISVDVKNLRDAGQKVSKTLILNALKPSDLIYTAL